MKKHEAMERSKTCIDEMVEALKGGTPESLNRYLDAMARFRNYSLNNLLMIINQYPDAEDVAGYRTWKDLGRWVRPGEKGIAIIAPVLGKRPEKRLSEDEHAEREERTYTGFRVVHVFDVKQTDGAELPRLSEVNDDAGAAYALLLDVFGSLGIHSYVVDHIRCGSTSRTDLRGGRLATAVPPAIPGEVLPMGRLGSPAWPVAKPSFN